MAQAHDLQNCLDMTENTAKNFFLTTFRKHAKMQVELNRIKHHLQVASRILAAVTVVNITVAAINIYFAVV